MARKAPQRRPLMTEAEAAEYMGFTKRKMRRWRDEDKLPISYIKVQGRIYYEPESLDAWRAAMARIGPNVVV